MSRRLSWRFFPVVAVAAGAVAVVFLMDEEVVAEDDPVAFGTDFAVVVAVAVELEVGVAASVGGSSMSSASSRRL